MYTDQALLEYYPAPFTPLTNPPRCPVMEMTIAVTTCTPYRTRTHCELDFWYKATTDHISRLASPPNIKCSNRLPFRCAPSNWNRHARSPVATTGIDAIAAASWL